MELVESINLVNNSVISAIDKLNVKDGDKLIFRIRLDENGDYLVTAEELEICYEFIQNFLNQNYKDVDFIMIPDGFRYDNDGIRYDNGIYKED